MLVVGEKGDGGRTKTSPPYHGAGRNDDRIRLQVVRPLLCTPSSYNNGRILSAAVMVTWLGTGSTATEVILSPSVTITYRCRRNL